jgi:acyl-CoA reductase-like NAD-dependent aldehyde dehydrogenase
LSRKESPTQWSLDLAEIAKSIRLGDPLDDDTRRWVQLLRLHNATKYCRSLVTRKTYARLISGGTRPNDPQLQSGSYVSPTVFADVSPSSPLAQQEIFGPVLAITRFENEAEAIDIANSTEFGLASGLWTRDLAPCSQSGTRTHRRDSVD